ncbi:MAG: aldolase [Nocardioides sp.]
MACPGSGSGRSDVDLDRLGEELDVRLEAADRTLVRDYPGQRAGRQPVHTVYVPADRFHAGLVTEYGGLALASIDEHEALLVELLDDDGSLVDRVREKLAGEPVEDLRIDFEDGYGPRSDEEEDGAARVAARELRRAVADGVASPFSGIRFKSFERPTRARGLRTLVLFLDALLEDGPLPEGFVVTLPKVTSVDQVEALVHTMQRLEADLGLTREALGFELQIETPQSILGPEGTALVAPMIHASAGRCTGLHYGTYDYSAFCGIAASQQSLDHAVADHAKAVMQAAAAGTGVRLSDGSSNRLPIGGPDAVRDAWADHLRLVRRSLERGYYQGWDLHPAQLPTRFGATFSFYRSGFGAAAQRLRDYVGRQESGILDEPATARALADFLLRGLDCGAIVDDDVAVATGLDVGRLADLAHRAGGEGS